MPQEISGGKMKLALAGSVLAGIGASACCVGPLLLLSLGISGAWIGHLTSFEPYRPMFVSLTVILLFVAYWKLYRAPRSCNVEASCSASRTRQKILFWVLLPISLCLAASPWMLPFFYR